MKTTRAMKTWKPTRLLTALVAAFALALNSHATVIRTLAYHQLTTLPLWGENLIIHRNC